MDVISATVRVTVPKLLELANSKLSLVWGFKKDLTKLSNSLEMINSVLEDAEKRQVTNGAVRLWLKNLRDVADDAGYILDEINYENMRRMAEDKPLTYEMLLMCLCFSFFTPLAFRWKMAHRIEEINVKFQEIKQLTLELHLQPVGNYPLTLPLVMETDGITVDPIVVGRQNEESEIVQQITTPVNEVLSVLPIVGMGGLGKTTLTRSIFNHQQTQSHFPLRIWVCVAENFDVLTLFKRILESLGESSHGDSRQAVVDKIRKNLGGKRYLLVLDDLWNEEEDKWNAFKNTLVGASSNKGNFIIVTTREEEAASIVKTCNDPYRLRLLTNEECWSIIRKITFQDKEVPTQFEIKVVEIASKCRGLPLAANMMGRVLQRKGMEEGLRVLHNGLSNLKEGEKGVLQVLKISYDRLLSPSVKKCFVYCTLFVKDSVLNRIDLIQLWMAEGFLPNNPGSDMETIGNAFFNILLQNFFFQEPEEDEYGNIIRCKMHDLVHDLACEVSKSDGFQNMEGRTADDIPQVRHLAIESIGEETDYKDVKEKASYLRTLFLTSSVPDEIFPYFKHLHVLKLSDAGIEELPTSIGKLKHLRYLDVSNNDDLTTLPDSVCKLYNLQTLRIITAFRYRLQRLPKDLQFLIHLRHLNFDYVVDDFEMPPGIKRLSSLQTLPLFCVSNKEGCRIDELGELKNLKGTLKVRNLELVSSKAEAEKADMARKLNIYELCFHWRRRSVDSTESNINDECVLEGLQPHENLKILRIDGFQGKNFPSWTRNMEIYKGVRGPRVTFDKLIGITFIGCDKCEEIPMLGQLPLLKYLYLEGLKNVTSIRPSFYGESDCSSTSSNDGQETRLSFPSLIRLTMLSMPNLIEWEETQTSGMQVFPCLEYLLLYECEKLTHVPHLRGSRLPLKEMEIWDCYQLRELPYDLGSLQSLERLVICRCNSLHSISYQNGQKGLSSLQMLAIRYCDELSNLPSKMLEFSTSLQHLEVTFCSKLTSFPEMSGIRSLQRLKFSVCDDLIQFPKLSGMGCLNSLRELTIKGNTDLVQFNTFQDSFNGIEHIKSLQKLSLWGQEDWVSLPNQLHHLTSLEELKIRGFGMEALPDWFGNFSFLRKLTLSNCKKLRHLPSKEAIQGLTGLRELGIVSCLVLGERCRQESGSDSEWSKISHIDRVKIYD